MKTKLLPAFLFLFLLAVAPASGQESPRSGESSQIEGFQVLGRERGIVYTREALFRTDDNGVNWTEVSLQRGLSQTISHVYFSDADRGWAVLADNSGSTLEIRQTADGGITWTASAVDIGPGELEETSIGNARLSASADRLLLTIPLETSSNFVGKVIFESADDGKIWQILSRTVELNAADERSAEISAGGWTLKTEGTCIGPKSGCVQETTLFRAGREITPPQVKESARINRENAAHEAVRLFAQPPGGNTRISLNKGFDKCQAGSVAQMQLWWDNSPHFDSNIYMSGRARACGAATQPFTNNPAWIDQVSAMGWGLIPTVVGYQAPCSVSTTIHKFSSDAVTAETQGRGEADIAAADALSIGLTAGSVLYYDMERYNDPGDGICRTATIAFLKGWTERIRELGYLSGVYGSPTNAVPDWWPMPAASRMDAIWMARWDNVMSVWVYNSPSPAFPAGAWANHQRIKQWQAPHNETWAGVTFNIDGNISDGPVAGINVAKNKNGDFDGDGKSDVSVFRPSDGIWYVLFSTTSTFSGVGFGNGTDIIAPGDFDGDGRTDYSIFRPSDGVWHMLGKAGTYAARQFGAAGDIPVAGDFNGDKKTDIAVFRPSNGAWYIANSDSLNTVTIIQFGQLGDKPVPGDYDGDGRTDMAVYRPSDGIWYILRSSDLSFYGVGFGNATDLPAQGDYDGDGKTDQAVYREGVWYLQQSTAGFAVVPFGLAGDLPATGDYDGDGKADVAVFRPSSGGWYLLRSQTGFYGVGFGQDGDRPVESAYLPQ